MTNLKDLVRKELEEQVLDNEDLLQLVSSINSYNGSLDHLSYYDNDEEFFQMMYGNNTILDAVRAVCYGEYNYTDDYVRIDAYGNLESKDEGELEKELKEAISEIVDNLLEINESNLVSDEIGHLIDLINNDYVDELTANEFISLLQNEHNVEEELTNQLDFKNNTCEQLYEILSESDLSLIGITTDFNGGIELLDNEVRFIKVENFYIVLYV